MPIKKLDSDSITCATVVFRPLAMAGNAGKYISIEKGPMAVSRPSMRMRLKWLRLFSINEGKGIEVFIYSRNFTVLFFGSHPYKCA
jgi:hypothetical protein